MSKKSNSRNKNWPKGLEVRADSYRFRRTIKGQQYWETWGVMSEARAITKAEEYNFEIRVGNDPIQRGEIARCTVEHFAREIWLPLKKVKPTTIVRYTNVVDNFLDYLKSIRITLVSKVTYSVAKDYIGHRGKLSPNSNRNPDQGAHNTTIRFEKGVLQDLFGEAENRELLATNPFRKLTVAAKPKNSEANSVRRPLSEQEEIEILAAARILDDQRTTKGAMLEDIIFFMLSTGCRDQEVCNLEWTDIDFDTRLINVSEKTIIETRRILIRDRLLGLFKKCMKGKKATSLLFSENDIKELANNFPIRKPSDQLALTVGDVSIDKAQVTFTQEYQWSPKQTQGQIPMCQKVSELLKRLKAKASSNFVFAHHDGGHCRYQLIKQLNRAQKIAGFVDHIRVHDLRHTFAVRLRERGVPLEIIMGMMRHADIKETLQYAPYEIKEGLTHISVLDGIPVEEANQRQRNKILRLIKDLDVENFEDIKLLLLS